MMLHPGKRFVVAAILCVVSADALQAEEKNGAAKPAVKADKPAVVADPLNIQIDKAIETTSKRQLTAGVHTPWQIMHGILAMRHDFRLKKSRESKTTETIKAIDWMGSGALHDNLTLFERTQFGGRARPFTRPYAFEGHANQFFGIFVMSDLPNDFSFKAGPSEVSIADMVENAKMEITQGPEITWTLWALSHYLDTNAQWRNRYGEAWSIERMVQIQTRESVISAPCGGTHGLFALSYARNKHLATGGKIRGVWMEADQKIKRFIEEGRVLQNRDGSFSTEYFRGRGFSNDFNDRIAHSGHMLEWLMMALPQSRLKEPWVRNGLNRLAKDLVENRKTAAECGPLYHALHSLILYRLRTRAEEYGPDKPTLLVKMKQETDQSQEPTAQEKTAVKPTDDKTADKKSADVNSEKAAAPAKAVSESKVTPVAAEAPNKTVPAVVIEAPVPDEVEEKTTDEAKSEEPAKAN